MSSDVLMFCISLVFKDKNKQHYIKARLQNMSHTTKQKKN